jgi:trimeric autotransporter adhesin
MRTKSATILIFLASTALAQTPILVKDIKPGGFSGILNTSNAAVAGNILYFSAVDSLHGEELWKTDGTETGTMLAKDINPDTASCQPKFYAVYNGQVYFTAKKAGLGTELWRTDDTEGAILAGGDICPGLCSGAAYSSSVGLFAEYNGNLIFQLNRELWKSDGTPSGTILLKDINPGTSAYGYPFGFVKFQGKLYFAADSANTGTEMWTSDGTDSGTHLFKDINPDVWGNSVSGQPAVGTDAFYFWAKNSTSNGAELWKSDGTPQGTMQLKDIRAGTDGGQPSYFGYIPMSNSVWLGDKLLFSADDGDIGPELWITDGTEAGTQLLYDIRTGVSGSNMQFLTDVNGKAYFRARSSSGQELWVSDGTAAGTHLVKDINPGTASSINPNVEVNYAVYEDKIYFTANDGTTGAELWVTDGTEAGTQLVFDLNPGAEASTPTNCQVMGDFLYFFATTLANGTELWKLSLKTSATATLENQIVTKVYPTLSTEGIFYFNHAGENTELLDVHVFDALGRLVHITRQSPDQALQLSALPTGAYFVRIATIDGKFTTQKVIIGR